MHTHDQTSVALTERSPESVASHLRALGIRRFFFVPDGQGGVRASHPELEAVADVLAADHCDYDQHEGIFCEVSEHADLIHGAFIHRTVRGQGQGGTRFWNYPTFMKFIRDGVRLSRGMTYKNALADIWWGGGKGVISCPPEFKRNHQELRQSIFEEYGRFISSLKGCYITAEDVGTTTDDMNAIFSQTRFITCIPRKKGGSGNPSGMTALGVVRGMEAGLSYLAGIRLKDTDRGSTSSPLKGKHVVVQGVGHVGQIVIDLVIKAGARVTATDINALRLDQLRDRWHGQPVELICTRPESLMPLDLACDVLCPAATGGSLNPVSIPHLKTSLICGASNNQLRDPERDGKAIAERGILYVPDFLVNRMGIVNCANEQYGYVTHDDGFDRHLSYDWGASVYQTSLRVIEHAMTGGGHPHQAAISLAEELSWQPHPIWGHRGHKIIRDLTACLSDQSMSSWANNSDLK